MEQCIDGSSAVKINAGHLQTIPISCQKILLYKFQESLKNLIIHKGYFPKAVLVLSRIMKLYKYV